MDTPKIDIDDVIAVKLTANQIKACFLVAYGKYPMHRIADICEISHKTIINWKDNNEYFKLLLRHIRKIELYHNLEEYTALKKASIASVIRLQEEALLNDDMKKLSKAVDAVTDLLNVFK